MTARVIGKKLSLKELGEDDTLWVSDLGVSRNMAKINMGIVEVRASTCADTFILCNSARIQATMMGDQKGCTKMTKIKVSNERYCHQAKFNLISLSAMLNRGWLLEGDKNE